MVRAASSSAFCWKTNGVWRKMALSLGWLTRAISSWWIDVITGLVSPDPKMAITRAGRVRGESIAECYGRRPGPAPPPRAGEGKRSARDQRLRIDEDDVRRLQVLHAAQVCPRCREVHLTFFAIDVADQREGNEEVVLHLQILADTHPHARALVSRTGSEGDNVRRRDEAAYRHPP